MTAPTRNKNAARAATKPVDTLEADQPVESPDTTGASTGTRKRRATAVDESAVGTPSDKAGARKRRPRRTTAEDTAANPEATTDAPTRARRSSASRRAAADVDAPAERRFGRGSSGSRRAADAEVDAPAERRFRRGSGSRRAAEAGLDAPVERGSRRGSGGSRGSAGTDVDAPAGRRFRRATAGSVDAEVEAGSHPARSRAAVGSARGARIDAMSGEPVVPVRTHGGIADTTATATVDAPAKPARTPSIDRPERVTGPSRPRTAAAERAYARRAHRDGHGSVAHAKVSAEEVASGRASFVVLIMALLAVGVAATLWLTTQAVADSYRLDNAKEEADRLAEQAAQLQREVTRKESASVLAERARQLGMVPAGDPARIVVGPDGSVTVVGEAKPVQPPPPPPAPVPPADPAAGAQAPPADGAQPPAAGTPPADGTQQQPAAGTPPADAAQPPPAGQTAPEGAAAPGGG